MNLKFAFLFLYDIISVDPPAEVVVYPRHATKDGFCISNDLTMLQGSEKVKQLSFQSNHLTSVDQFEFFAAWTKDGTRYAQPIRFERINTHCNMKVLDKQDVFIQFCQNMSSTQNFKRLAYVVAVPNMVYEEGKWIEKNDNPVKVFVTRDKPRTLYNSGMMFGIYIRYDVTFKITDGFIFIRRHKVDYIIPVQTYECKDEHVMNQFNIDKAHPIKRFEKAFKAHKQEQQGNGIDEVDSNPAFQIPKSKINETMLKVCKSKFEPIHVVNIKIHYGNGLMTTLKKGRNLLRYGWKSIGRRITRPLTR